MFGGVLEEVGNTIVDAPPMPSNTFLEPVGSPGRTIGTYMIYVANFFGGLLLFFLIFWAIVDILSSKKNAPPEDTTNSASGK